MKLFWETEQKVRGHEIAAALAAALTGRGNAG